MSNSNPDHRNDACKTYLEQTKLLVTLTSAFIIAPIAIFEKFQIMNLLVILMEISFILSVFAGYVVFGTIAGSQHTGECDVHNKRTKWSSLIQIVLFFLGIIFLLWNVSNDSSVSKQDEGSNSTISLNKECIFHNLGKTIYFDFDKTEIRPEAFKTINYYIEQLEKNKTLKIKISANTDSIGTDSHNLELSKQRAFVIKNYLISNGINFDRIEIEYLGELNPVTTNATYNGRVLNRRIDILLLNEDN